MPKKQSIKILFYAHFFSPEVGAGSLRAQYFVKTLKDAGFKVKVIAPIPNYPHGKPYPGYEKKYYVDRDNDVVYLPIYIPKSHSIIGRGLLYSSYLITSFVYNVINRFNPDIIISSSPPILTSLSAFVVSKLRGTKFILDLRDIWPDIGIELGLLKNRFIISILKMIEKLLIKNADKITVTAKGDRLNIIEKGINDDKVDVIYNGADTKLFYPKDEERINDLRKQFNLPIEKKLLIYFGSFNYGMNDIESMESALENVSNEKKQIHFIAVGGGVLKEEFLNSISVNMNYSSFQNLSNQEIADLVSVCDISLIPRKDIEKDTGGNIPVKCFESWAAGVPVLLSALANSEIARIFDDCIGGKMVKPSDPEEYKNGLISLLNDPQLKDLGNKGRNYVLGRFDRSHLAQRIIKIVEEVI
ncbi:MAG: glycosyltransferase family 4 protein [Bacteroidetes bacterium]|nr:glycosyltransferase family 4 protein [Bacteroidota bacterium]